MTEVPHRGHVRGKGHRADEDEGIRVRGHGWLRAEVVRVDTVRDDLHPPPRVELAQPIGVSLRHRRHDPVSAHRVPLDHRSSRGADPRPQRRRTAALGAQRLGVDQLEQPRAGEALAEPGHGQLSHVNDVEPLLPGHAAQGASELVSRGQVQERQHRQAISQMRFNRPRECIDRPAARDEVDRIEDVSKVTLIVFRRSGGRRGDQRAAMMPETPLDLVPDQGIALQQVRRWRPIDDEDVQTHARTASMLSDTHLRRRVASGCRAKFSETMRSQYSSNGTRRSSCAATAGRSHAVDGGLLFRLPPRVRTERPADLGADLASTQEFPAVEDEVQQIVRRTARRVLRCPSRRCP